MTDLGSTPLRGFTVAVTAARRRAELTSLLERRGAAVVEAPAIRIVPAGDDEALLTATRACLQRPPDVVVATTGIGFRGWMEAAEGWGLGETLRDQFAGTELVARGPKARGAVRAAGLAEAWAPESEASDEMLSRLLERGVDGERIVVQLHGEPLTGFSAALRAAGAEVIEVPVYRWVPAHDRRPLRRLVQRVVAEQVDCVTFTSAPAVASMLATASELELHDRLLESLRAPVLAACVGPVTAAPLVDRDVPVVQPERARLGALVRTVVAELPARRTRSLQAGEHLLELRGHTVLVDGRPVALTARQSRLLGALIDAGGRAMSRSALLETAWLGETADEHAVEMTVARLRRVLGPAGAVVQTVVKRGYRLAPPEAAQGSNAAVQTW